MASVRLAYLRPREFEKTWSALAVGVAFGVAAMLVYPGGTPLDAAMIVYPGGTPLDAATVGVFTNALTRNFLSDLGTTVAYNGRPNQTGALLFVLSLGTFIPVYIASLLRIARFLSDRPARGTRSHGD